MKTFSFIGVGNMASAIIKGLGKDAFIVLYDKDESKSRAFEGENYYVAGSAGEAVAKGDYTVLAVKPQNMNEVLDDIAASGIDFTDKTVISIAAGIPISRITGRLGDIPVVRTIPNTPLMIGEGVTAICRNEFVGDASFDEIVTMFGKVSLTAIMPESELDTVISATSSAPAYIYLMIKAICDGARAQGLDCAGLTEMVCQTVIGSAKMVMQSGRTPDELIRMVTSPNGTTERAMKVFYSNGFEAVVLEAMKECTKRAKELSNG